MAKILFGIQSFGLGHYTRSITVIEHLIQEGHHIKVLSSDKVYKIIKDRYESYEIARLVFKLKNNRVDYFSTFLNFLIELPKRIFQGNLKVRKLVKEYQPDIIISDFELFSAKIAARYHIPHISIDNLHILYYTDAIKTSGVKQSLTAFLQKAAVRLLMPRPDRCLIPTFFQVRCIDPGMTTLIQPLIRPEIIIAKKHRSGSHILVYHSTALNMDKEFLSMMKQFPQQQFIIYGFQRDYSDDNILFKKESNEGFIKDLAQCHAVITNGGLSLICESLFLHKPVLSLPIPGQYEQTLNASHLDRLGYGKYSESLTPEVMQDFFNAIPHYVDNLKKYTQKDNVESLRIIDNSINDLLNKNHL